MWHAQALLRRLLRSQLGAGDFILVVHPHACQHRNGDRGGNRQTSDAAPWPLVDLGRYGFVSQRRRHRRGDIQVGQQQLLVHSCTGYLVTRPGGTGFSIVYGAQHPTQFQFVRFVIHYRGQRFLQSFTTHGGSSLGCRRCLRFPATTAAGLCLWPPERGRFESARYPPDIA